MEAARWEQSNTEEEFKEPEGTTEFGNEISRLDGSILDITSKLLELDAE